MPEPPRDEGSLQAWNVLSRHEVADCKVFKIWRHHCGLENDHREDDFYVIDAPDWVVVLAITPQDKIVLVRQYRFGCEDFFLEFPAGVMEPGEDAVTAGLRELREETGFQAENIRLMGKVHPNPALQNNTCHFVLAEGAEPGTGTQWDEHEQIEVCLLPVKEVMRQALDGRINHALAINALHFFGPLREGQTKA